MPTSLLDSQPGYMEFYKLQEQSAYEREFIDSHKDSWIHGVPNSYNIIEYEPFQSTASNADYENVNKSEAYFAPKVVVNKFQPGNTNTRLSSITSAQSDPKVSKYAADFQKDKNASPFSGLFHIPAFSYSYPGHPTPQNLSAFVYQTHFEVGEITYMFGGLFEHPQMSLRNLGIPRSTDLSRISVHLPYEMPPYVNKEILMSPLMAQNPFFIIFNPTRGTVTFYDMGILGDTYPGNLCQLKGTLVSPHHVFYCGGYEVKVDSVHFDEDVKRWIVKKSIVTNDNGYILDVTKMLLTKIELKSKLDLNYTGRLGSGLVSNVFDHKISRDEDIALPVNDVNNSGPFTPFPDLSEGEFDLPKPDDKKEPPKLKRELLKKELSVQTQSTQSTVTSSSRVGTRVTTDQSSQRTVNSGATRSNSTRSRQSDTSKNSDSPLSPSASSSGGSLKVSTIFQKSTRLFHRNSVRHSGHGLASIQSAYSNQVKQHRSQTLLSSQNSRPASPLRLSMKSPPNRSNADALSIVSESTDTDSYHSEHSTTSSTPIATPTPRKLHHHVGNPEKTISAEAESVVSGESANYGAFLFADSALRSGILSVSVYQFGGFKYIVDSTGKRQLVASNELLKIELIIDDPARLVFHPEALIFEETPRGRNTPWPSARGFFAFALIQNDSKSESCDLVEPIVFQDNESSKSLVSLSEVLSLSEKSTRKSHGSYNADNFFELKSLMIHGGVNEKSEVFSEMYLFNFNTGTWLLSLTYAFDYYDLPKQPYDDEKTELLTLEAQVDNPKLVDAELRCCHHQALIYREDGREYVMFLGGFTNDFLRHHEKTPYTSEKFDVSRLARFLISSTNSNLLRVPVLNLRSQTWKFSRFFYDLSERVSPSAMDLLMGSDYLRNSRLCFYGGAFSIVGKQITICHGMVEFVPEKAEHHGKINKYLEADSFLLGGHCHLTFPNM